MSISGWLKENGYLLEELLKRSEDTILVELSSNMEIVDCNQGFLQIFALTEKPTGRHIKEYLDNDSYDRLRSKNDRSLQKIKLNFVLPASVKYILNAHLVKDSTNRRLIYGSKLMLTNNDLMVEMSRLNDEMVNLNRQLSKRKSALEMALSRIKTLEGIVPICMFCHRIRDDTDAWQKLEAYLEAHSDAKFSHSLCSECLRKHYPEDADYVQKKPIGE